MTEGVAAVTMASVESTRTQSSSLLWRIAPLAVALGSFALGAVALGHRSLSSDEAVTLGQANGSLRAVLSRLWHHDPAQTGGVLLVKIGSSFGSDELALRLPAAVAVALAAGLLVVLGTMLMGRVAGLVGGLAFGLNAGVVEASRSARPYAAGLLGIVLATLLFVWALERGGGLRWGMYAIAAACLPLTHPLAASVLAAHAVVLIVLRDRRPELRAAGVALLLGSVVAAMLLGWMAADRHGDVDGARSLTLDRVAHGLAHAFGWNPVLAVGAVAGIVLLIGFAEDARRRWVGVLFAGLILAPVVATLAAAAVLPVYTGALVLCAPGIALAVGAVAPVLARTHGLLWAGIALLVVSAGGSVGWRVTRPATEDWRALAAAVERVRQPRETVVVVPDGARAAFAYYAPDVHVIRFVRGESAWVAVVADTPAGAIAAARPVVQTPRYALLRQFRYGDGLRLQHWVRP